MALNFKGEATTAILNNTENVYKKDDLFRLYDAGILTLGNVICEHGDFVSWNGTAWQLEKNAGYAVETGGASESLEERVGAIEETIPDDASANNKLVSESGLQAAISEVTLDPSAVALGNVHLLDEVTEFPADGCILIDSETNGPGEMSKDTLLELTAQNALAGNVAPAFVENSTNAISGCLYSWEGETYVAKEDYIGTWDASKFEQVSVDELLDKFRNVLSFYTQDSHVLTSSNTLSNQSYPDFWATYYKVFVPKGAVVNYKNIGQNLGAGFAYIYIIDLEGNDLYTKLGGSGTADFDVSYTMPEDGYVSLCGTPRSTIQISVNCPIGHSFEGAYIRKFEAETKTFEAETKTFEANVTQKFNDIESVLRYYTQSVYALTSSNTLSNQSYPDLWATYYKLFVPKGSVVHYRNDGSYLVSGFAYVYIIDLDGNDLYKKLGSSENTPFDITYTMPEDGYVSLCGTPRSAIQISVNCPSSYDYYDKVVMQPLKNDVEGLKTETYLGDEFAAFRKFGVIGDSLSVGYMTDSNNVVNQRNLPYSWGQVLARKNAQVCLNFGKSGITTTTWWTDSVCKDLLVLPENQCQAYIVGIGTNDVINESFPIGSMSDIDWSDYNNNANSFYGHYARILQLILSVAPKAIIFVLTLPYPRADAAKNTAFRNICADAHLSSNVFLADLQADYNDLFKTIGDRYANDYHFTAAGYAAIATTLGVIVSETIRKNSSVDAIKDIGFIPFGSNDSI